MKRLKNCTHPIKFLHVAASGHYLEKSKVQSLASTNTTVLVLH